MKYHFVLGSLSPRRKSLLSLLNIPFSIRGSDQDEPSREKGENSKDFSLRISEFKASCLMDQLKDGELLLTSDTIVSFNDLILGKPKSREEAFKTLRSLSMKTHEVLTSYVLRTKSEVFKKEVICTKVHFRKLSHIDINNYLDLNTFLDKAGSYAIQEEASHFVRSVEGSVNNVVGLPIEIIVKLLESRLGESWRDFFVDN